MPGRHPRGPDNWDGDEGDSPGSAGRDADREPGLRPEYHTEQGLTPEEREAAGESRDEDGEPTGGSRGGSYAPTAEEAAARKRGVGGGRDDPGAWFGRPPNPPKPRRRPTVGEPKK
jgi:hypothetical protein